MFHQHTQNYRNIFVAKPRGEDSGSWRGWAAGRPAIGEWSLNRGRCLDEQDGGGGNASPAKLTPGGGLLTLPGISWRQIRPRVYLSTAEVPSPWQRHFWNGVGNGASGRVRWGKEQGCLSFLLVGTWLLVAGQRVEKCISELSLGFYVLVTNAALFSWSLLLISPSYMKCFFSPSFFPSTIPCLAVAVTE